MDGDGAEDLLLVNEGPPAPYQRSTVVVHRSHVDGVVEPLVFHTVRAVMGGWVAVGDADGDHHADLWFSDGSVLRHSVAPVDPTSATDGPSDSGDTGDTADTGTGHTGDTGGR